MINAKSIKRHYNVLFYFDAKKRRLLYQCLEQQQRGNIATEKGLKQLRAIDGLGKEMQAVVSAAIVPVIGGESLASALRSTNTFPLEEIAYIEAAEKHGALAEVLHMLATRESDTQGILSILTDNAYYLVMLAMLLGLYYFAGVGVDSFAAINPAAADILAAQIIYSVNDFGLAALLAVAAAGSFLMYGRRNFIGWPRRFLLGFSREYTRVCAAQFCNLAGLVLSFGIDHTELLNIARQTMRGEYAQDGVIETDRRLRNGLDLLNALDNTLLDRSTKAIIQGLVPTNDPASYSTAFITGGRMVSVLLADSYRTASRLLKLFLLSTIALGIVIIMAGMLEATALISESIR